jgi:hypothetical protein
MSSSSQIGEKKDSCSWIDKQLRLHARLERAIEKNEVGHLNEGDMVVMDDKGRVAAARSFSAALRILGIDTPLPGQVASMLYPLYLNNTNATGEAE